MKHPFELKENCSSEDAAEQYTLVAGDLCNALEVIDDLQQALCAILDDPANPLKVSCRLRLGYLTQRAIAMLDEHEFGALYES